MSGKFGIRQGCLSQLTVNISCRICNGKTKEGETPLRQVRQIGKANRFSFDHSDAESSLSDSSRIARADSNILARTNLLSADESVRLVCWLEDGKLDILMTTPGNCLDCVFMILWRFIGVGLLSGEGFIVGERF
jgi:hypothetical protein